MSKRPKRLPEDLTDVLLDDLIRLIVRTQERLRNEANAELHVRFEIVPIKATADQGSGGQS